MTIVVGVALTQSPAIAQVQCADLPEDAIGRAGGVVATYDPLFEYSGGFSTNDMNHESAEHATTRSVIMIDDATGLDFVEFGWQRRTGEAEPRLFMTYQINGIQPSGWPWYGEILTQDWNTFGFYVNWGSTWRATLNGVEKRSVAHIFTTGIMLVQAERENTCDEARSRWWDSHGRRGSGVYPGWAFLAQWADTDPDYGCDKVSDGEWRNILIVNGDCPPLYVPDPPIPHPA